MSGGSGVLSEPGWKAIGSGRLDAAKARLRCLWCVMLALTVAWATGGCASIRVTDPPRTATEQFLLAKAAEAAVEQLTFEPIRGRRVFVDSTYFAASEEAFVLGELRAQLLLAGVQLVPEP